MAIINKMREKMGKLIVLAVGFAIVSFIAADLTGPNSVLFGGQSLEIGEISGKEISLDEFRAQVDDLTYNFTLNQGRNPSGDEKNFLRQQAWDYFLIKIAYQDQFDAIGLDVTDDEVVDMVQGNNISAQLQQAFTNPETGEFDRDAIINYLKDIGQKPSQEQAAWYAFESTLGPSRLRLKYDNLLSRSIYVTNEEAMKEYRNQNQTASAKYLYIPYRTINDSLIQYDENDLEEYLESHGEEYQVEESRSLSYVTFPVTASGQDSALFREDLEQLVPQFQTVVEDSVFARINSDGNIFYVTYKIADLPGVLKDVEMEEGKIIGPYLIAGRYVLYKVSKVLEDSIYSARANHILFKADGTSDQAKSSAKREAEKILRQIKNGAEFAEMARKYGTDGTATRGGDVGWFSEKGAMAQPFKDAIFGREDAGLIPVVTETQFGFHIIEITKAKTNKGFKIAMIEREIIPTDETRDKAFRKADYFAGTSTNLDEFIQNAERDSLLVLSADKINQNARRINNLTTARVVVRWLFNDASPESVSKVFELGDSYVVAVMNDEIVKGTAPLEEVRIEVTSKFKNELKAQYILKSLMDLSGTLEEIAESYGSDARVSVAENVKLSGNNLDGIGTAPLALGNLYSLKEGETSEPIQEENGVVIIQLESFTESPEIADYTSYKTQITQRKNSRSSYILSETIREEANIIDKRYKFF